MKIRKQKISDLPKVRNIEDFIALGVDKGTNDNAVADMDQLYSNFVLPTVEVRLLLDAKLKTSQLFPNETALIDSGRLQFKINANKAVIKRLMESDVRIALGRKNRRWHRTKKCANHGWHVVGGTENSMGNIYSYPAVDTFSVVGQSKKVIWTPNQNLYPVLLRNLINDDFNGDWIDFPYPLEMIIRRYVYLKQQTEGSEYFNILPLAKYYGGYVPTPANSSVTLCIAGSKHYHTIYGKVADDKYAPRTSERKTMATLPLSIGLVREISENSNNVFWAQGVFREFAGVVKLAGNDILLYRIQTTFKTNKLR